MDLDKAIKERFSCRSFKSKKPDWKKIISAIESASKAPLAGNISTLRFILISDKEKIQELAKASMQDFLSEVHYIVAVCSEPGKASQSYDERGEKYALEQAGAAIENFLLKITELGLATCWVGAFSDETVSRVLQLPESIEPIALLPIGYAMKKEKQRLKPNLDSILYFDVWKNKHMTRISKPEGL